MLKKNTLLLCLFLSTAFLSTTLIGQSIDNIETVLFDLPDIRFKKISADDAENQQFECFIKQPIDHTDASKGYFYQRIYLTHKGYDAPTVMNTQGYGLHLGKNEVAAILDANYINIEHRFFGKSIPKSKDWQYLTLEQATADLHHINQIFKEIYHGKWVSTGISKGGQTTIYYRYFYPEDVDVSMPYVAPLNLDLNDKRIYTFLDTIGSEECRKKIHHVQETLLKNKAEVLTKLKWFAQGADLHFEYLGSLEAAFEYAILEYSFSFWQWGGDCDKLPTSNDVDACLQSFIDIVGLSFYDDESMEIYAPHYYQASSQMGYYGFETKAFKKYINALPKNPNASFAPKEAGTIQFSNKLPKAVSKWLETNGNHFVYIYGALDTWSATRVIPSANVDAKYYHMAGKHHGSARIKNLTAVEQKELADALSKWLGVTVNMDALAESKEKK